MFHGRRWLLALLSIACVAAIHCSWSEDDDSIAIGNDEAEKSSTRPSIVLIFIDTLRSDHLGSYGASRATTPNIDALAEEGVLFERAYSPAPWTKPSAASVLTGLYPSAHGVTGFRSKLGAELVTLAELFQRAGYATGAVVSGYFLSARFGFGQGFDEFDETTLGSEKSITSRKVSSLALAFAERADRSGNPFFLLAHYFDPHYAYLDHPEVDFARKNAGRLQGSESIEVLRAISDLTVDERAFIVDRYDEEIRHTDEAIGNLLQGLEELKSGRNLVTVVSADHGEELLDRGWLGHTRTLYEELLRVPLIIHLSDGYPGRRVSQVVSTVALAPTLVEIAQIDSEGAAFQEASLLPLLRGGKEDRQATALGQVDYVPFFKKNAKKAAHKNTLIGDRLKLIRDEGTGRLELYDLLDDPKEIRDLAQSHSDVAQKLAAELDERLSIVSAKPATSTEGILTDEEIKKLRALGYVENEESAR